MSLGAGKPDRGRSPQLRYKTVREQIRSGDVLLFQGKGLLSWIIRQGSESNYSHAAIASWEGQRLMIYHAVFKGIRHVPASEAVDEYDGQVDWFGLNPPFDGQLDRDGVVHQAKAHVGKPFATVGMFKLMWLMLLGRYRAVLDGVNPPPAMFCSWYVSRCYRVGGGIDLCPETADRCTSPAMLERGGLLYMRGILHRDPEQLLTDQPAEPAQLG